MAYWSRYKPSRHFKTRAAFHRAVDSGTSIAILDQEDEMVLDDGTYTVQGEWGCYSRVELKNGLVISARRY